jgi:hypothetical protein
MAEDDDINDINNLVGIDDLVNKDFIDESFNISNIDKLLNDDTLNMVDEEPIKEENIDLESQLENGGDDPLEEDNLSDADDAPNVSESSFNTGHARFEQSIQMPSPSPPSSQYAMSSFANNRNQVRSNDDIILMKEEIDELLTYILEECPDLRGKYEHMINDDSSKIPDNLKFLQAKYNRVRAKSLGRDVIIAGAQCLEWYFDGEREIGPFKPDLTGWSNTIRPKVRRIQNETGTIISGIMDDLNVGPWFKIGIELIPSAVIYSRLRKDQYGKKGYTPSQMSDAYDELCSFNKN